MGKKVRKKDYIPDGTRLVKYVKKASQWCITTWENGIQKQQWVNEKNDKWLGIKGDSEEDFLKQLNNNNTLKNILDKKQQWVNEKPYE